MATNRVLLAVDLSYQVHRACSAHPTLSRARDELYTGGLYGFLQQFGTAVRETGATAAVACLDSKPYVRSLAYPDYKRLRRKEPDEDRLERYRATEPLVVELLGLMGVPVWGVPGFESDDLIALLAERDRSRWARVYAMSNDSDLHQLLDIPNFSVFQTSARDALHSAPRDVFGQPMTRSEFVLYLAMMGTHNDVAGIPGIGPVKSLKAIREPALLRQLRDAHGALIDRNAALIRLPHPDLPRRAGPPAPGRRGTPRDLYRWAADFDIDVTLPMVNAFDQLGR